MNGRLRAPSPAFVIALIALFVALGGTAYAATTLPKNSVGTRQIKNRAVVTSKIKNGAVTARKINTTGLIVPNSAHAVDADELGGNAPAAFQSRVTGACKGNSGVAEIGPSGSVTCANAQFYSGRLVESVPVSGFPTFLTIPGVAHIEILNCLASGANAEVRNDSSGATDLWYSGDTNYLGTGWLAANTPFTTTAGTTFHIGEGSGSGAEAITITINTEATGTTCVFQAAAEVIGSS